MLLGTFGVAEQFAIQADSDAFGTAAVLNDFNKDGVPDIAFGSAHRRQRLDKQHAAVGIVLGEIGSFHLAAERAVHDDVTRIVAADLNDDGFDDIVAGGIYRLSIFLSEVEDGHWVGLSEPTYIGGAADNIVVDDFDQDGKLDIASTALAHRLDNPQGHPHDLSFSNRHTTGLYIYAGDGLGGFSQVARYAGNSYLISTDHDGDGDTDLITRGLSDDIQSTGVLLNDSSETISFKIGGAVNWASVKHHLDPPDVDINGDEFPDRIGSQAYFDSGNFSTPSETIYQLGQPDGSFGDSLHLAPGAFGDAGTFGLGTNVVSSIRPFIYDFDGNNKNDFLVFGLRSIRIVRQLTEVEGYAMTATNFPSISDRLYESRFYDLNSDGRLDFVASNGIAEPNLLVQEGNAGGTFGSAYVLTPAELQDRFDRFGVPQIYSPADIFRGDFNQDGIQDRIEETTHNVWHVVLVGPAGDTTTTQEIDLSNRQGRLESLRDMNADSIPDLVVTVREEETSDATRVVMRGDGRGRFLSGETFVATHPPSTYHRDGGIGVIVHKDTSHAYWWQAPRATSFQLAIPNQSGVQPGTGGPSHESIQTDVDGDGDLDLVIGHGSGVAVVLAVGEGDFNRDGKRDASDLAILVGHYGSAEPTPRQGDMNDDGEVDFADFLRFLRQYSVR